MLRRYLTLLLFVAGCATPIAPSGGPQDTTPPGLESAEPARDAVNVRTDQLVLTFSEDVDEASVRRAFSLAPAPDNAPDIVVRGRRVEVRFADSLRVNTTYVATFDTNLRDLRNVALQRPLTFAFSTGPVLDRGRIAGRVLANRTGAPVAGIDVFAYALPDSVAADSTAGWSLPDVRTATPDYRTQTDDDGGFALDYLRPTPFFVAVVADADRDRQASAGEAFAVPYEPTVRPVVPDSGDVPTLRFFRTALDTIPPALLRIRPRSASRLAVRFDEAVVLQRRATDAWRLADTTTGRSPAVLNVYADDDPQQIVLRTEPLANVGHKLWLDDFSAVTDSAGNVARPDTLAFLPAAEADTLGTRFLGFLPEASGAATRLAPTDTAGIRFNAPPDSATLGRVAVADTLGNPLPFDFSTRDGVRYRIVPDAGDTDGRAPFRVEVPQPDSTYGRLFEPLSPDALGDLAGVVVTDAGPIIVELTRGRTRLSARTDSAGAFRFDRLPEGEVRLRAFVDQNENGVWDGGRLAPYEPPEPLRFFPTRPSVRPRWETVLDTLAFE